MGSGPPQREPLEWLASDFASRCRRGECPTIAEYVAQYPEYAAKIEELLPAVAMLEQLRNWERSLREVSSGKQSEC